MNPRTFDYVRGQWRGLNDVLCYLQTLETKTVDKREIYKAVHDMRPDMTELNDFDPGVKRRIYTFGANEGGRHGKGSALTAFQKHGAILGQGYGLQGNSFGIPTKSAELRVLPLSHIRRYILLFQQFARQHEDDMIFDIVDIGCMNAGYEPQQIAGLFSPVRKNLNFVGELKHFVVYKTEKD